MIVDILTYYLRPATFFLCVVLSIFLFTLRKGPVKQNRLLALFILAIGVELSSRIIWWHVPVMQEFRPFFVILMDFRFIVSPLFYLYLRAVFKPETKFKPYDLLHLAVIALVLTLQFLSRAFWLQPWKAFILVDLMQMMAYLAFSFFRFRMPKLFTDPEFFKFDWLKVIWLRFFLISLLATLLVLVISLLVALEVIRLPEWDYWIMRLAGFVNFIFINIIVLIALNVPELFRSLGKGGSPLPESLREQYLEKLQAHMRSIKPYRDPDISLHKLAQNIGIPVKQLSALINKSYGQNFYRYVNSFRIDECKRLLRDTSQNRLNIIEIAFETGFNSKNSFNLAFKNETGMTPREYRDSLPEEK